MRLSEPAASSDSAARATRPTDWLLIALAAALALPWGWFWLNGVHPDPIATSLLTGLAILGAAFLLSWAAEAFQIDVSQAFALALLALIAVLPEYAVDAAFAWKAAVDPAYAGYAVANMTGANRLLIGVGWSAIVLVAWLRYGVRRVHLERENALELGVLLVATLYALTIPLKGSLSIVDTVVLVALFGFYAWATTRAPAEHPDLVGPARSVGQLPSGRRRLVTLAMFLYAAGAIFVSAEAFAEGVVQSGVRLGIDEFLLVQWLAPLASEAPEFLVAMLFAWRGQAVAGLRTLVSSKVNQWTLLIATLPLVYSFGKGAPAALPLDPRQQQEILLTAAQSLFALVVIANFVMGRREALLLFTLFAVQLVFPDETVRWAMMVLYFVLAAGLFALDRTIRAGLRSLPGLVRLSLTGSPPAAEPPTRAGRRPGEHTPEDRLPAPPPVVQDERRAWRDEKR
ncbi:MAG: sodium:calcium antiporter [Chloroflexi bacterium]|nr:sodium:calcium antiporter [Chloroflexota bacterium]